MTNEQIIKPFDKLRVNGEQSRTIKCVFCQGSGDNPHFRGTCPVCKGRGKNEVRGKYMTCGSCRGLGQKKGTTLTCYDCGGVGIIPDTRETFRKAREEIGEAQEEIARERPARHRLSPLATAGGEELTEKRVVNGIPEGTRRYPLPVGTRLGTERKDKEDRWKEESFDSAQDKKEEEESSEETRFCQCCADKVNESMTIKICHDCFGKMKEIA